MSWPQWSQSTGAVAGWSGTGLAPVAPTVGALQAPGSAYTPEQWAAMQQQNWQQWVQWQQQYQQWQQQYGEQYQKSLALAGQTTPGIPLMPVQPPLPVADPKSAPPLPTDTRPPLPPEEPPRNILPIVAAPSVTYNVNVPPPNAPPLPQEQQNTLQQPMQNPPGQNYGQNRYCNTSQPPPSLLSLPISKPAFIENQQSRSQNFRSEFSNKRSGEYNNEHFEDAKKNRWEAPQPEKEQKQWNTNQTQQRGQQWANNKSQGHRPNVEELSEAEKNFDKQFEQWEAQFNKWKEQNAGHPDKQQYKEYEAKWECWRAQLLERREQMRKKRLGILGSPAQSTTSKPSTPIVGPPIAVINSPVGINPPQQLKSEHAINKDLTKLSMPTPTIINDKLVEDKADNKDKEDYSENDISVLFSQPPKEQRTNIRQRRVSIKSDSGSITDTSFLKSSLTSEGGIPGLDLVKDDDSKLPDNKEDEKKTETNSKLPDFEAISKGINSILGDEKLLSMLSMVAQNKKIEPLNTPDSQNNTRNSNNMQDEYNNSYQSTDSLANQNFSNDQFGQNQYNNNYDQQMLNQRGTNRDILDRGPQGSNNFNSLPNFNQPPNNYNRGPQNRDRDHFNQDASNRDSNEFNKFPSSRGNFGADNREHNDFGKLNHDFGPPNRGPNHFNQEARGPSDFNQGPLNNFNRGPSNFNQGPTGRGSNFNRELGDFNPGHFNRGPGDFNPSSSNRGGFFNQGPLRRGLGDFSQAPPNRPAGGTPFRSSSDFNHGPPNRGLGDFNQGPTNQGGSCDFNQPPPNRGPVDFNQGPVNRGHGDFNQGPPNRGSGDFKQSPLNRGPANFNQDPTNRLPGDFNQGPANRAPGNFNQPNKGHVDSNQGPPNKSLMDFNQGPPNRSSGDNNQGTPNRGPGDFSINPLNRGPGDFNQGSPNKGPGDFSQGPPNRGPGDFSQGPPNRGPGDTSKGPLNRGPGDMSQGPPNRGSGDFNQEQPNRGPGNFSQGPPNRGPGDFNQGQTNRGPGNFSQGPPSRGSGDFNQGPPSRGSGEFNQGPPNKGPGDFNQGPLNRGSPADFNQGPPNRRSGEFNLGPPRGTDNFHQGPNRGQSDFNQGPPNRSSVDFNQVPPNRGPNDFIQGQPTRGHDDFSHGPPNRGPNDMNQGPPNRAPQNFNQGSNWGLPNRHSNDFNAPPNRISGSENQRPTPFNPDDGSLNRKFDSVNQPPNCDQWNPNNNPDFSEEGYSEDPENTNEIPPNENEQPDLMQEDYNEDEGNLDNSRDFSRNRPGRWSGDNKFSDDRSYSDPTRFPNSGMRRSNPDQFFRGSNDKYWDEALILKPVTVVDYGHKSINKPEKNFIEPVQTFDYGHTSKTADKKINENEPVRNFPPKFNRFSDPGPKFNRNYPSKPSNVGLGMRDDNSVFHRKSYDNRRSQDTFDRFPQKNRSFNKSFDDDKYQYEDIDDFEDDPFEEPEFNRSSTDRELEAFANKPNPGFEIESRPSNQDEKSMVTMIEDLLVPPGKNSRPLRIVIILRGPPGSGKTFLAKLIKDKEVEQGGSAPRILSLDDYFMVEQDKEIFDKETGRKTTVKEMVYEYEECMELAYRQGLEKAFKKTITDGFFPFIILDCVNDKTKHFADMWSFAKQNGFQVYVCQMELEVAACTKRNIHHRSEIEIERLVAGWEPTPSHYLILDATSLIQAGCISDVEMEEVTELDDVEKDDENIEGHVISKWERMEPSGDKLARLDGISKPLRPRATMEDYLQLDDDIPEEKPGLKRVRWADLEERRRQDKMRAIGFVVGQTDWGRMMDPTQGGSALTQTKYIERVRRF